MKNPNGKEAPSQTIKQPNKELEGVKIKNSSINSMVEVFHRQHGAALRKRFYPNNPQKTARKKLAVAKSCRLFRVSR